MARRSYNSDLPPPFLKRLSFLEERVEADEFPFTIPAFQRGKLTLDFQRPITIIVGENGTGKSTLLEAIAIQAGSTSLAAIATMSSARTSTTRRQPGPCVCRGCRK
jgi:predicted ATPase